MSAEAPLRTLLRVDDLSVHVGAVPTGALHTRAVHAGAAHTGSAHTTARALLRGVSFELRPGECLTLLGESGAGKSLLAQAIIGSLPPGLRAGGSVTLADNSSRADDARARRRHWGRAVALLPQEPMLALDPLMRIAPQLAEVYRCVHGQSRPQARLRAANALAGVGLAGASHQYPWQISGGMAQRAAAVIALAGGAPVLIVDEPTKGLDAYWRTRMIETLQAVQHAGGCVLAITHDLRVARALSGRLIVLRDGEVVEQGDGQAVLARPQHSFTRRLIAAEPARWPRHRTEPAADLVIEAIGLSKRFGPRTLFAALDVQLRRRDRLVLQGPSGVGKSTLGNVLLGLLPADAGRVVRAPDLPPAALQKLYQEPATSFAPHSSLEQTLRDVARLHRRPWRDITQRLEALRIAPSLLERKPAQISGGELQRIALARALTAAPALIFADEPTSRLDPITQQEAMAVLLEAVDACDAALLLVTHDEDIAAAIGTRTLRLCTEDAPG